MDSERGSELPEQVPAERPATEEQTDITANEPSPPPAADSAGAGTPVSERAQDSWESRPGQPGVPPPTAAGQSPQPPLWTPLGSASPIWPDAVGENVPQDPLSQPPAGPQAPAGPPQPQFPSYPNAWPPSRPQVPPAWSTQPPSMPPGQSPATPPPWGRPSWGGSPWAGQPVQPAWPPAPQAAWPPSPLAGPQPGLYWNDGRQRRSVWERASGPLLGVLAAALIAFGGGMLIGRASAPGATSANGTSGNTAPLDGFGVYNEALQLVRQHYVNSGSVDDKTLVYGSIRGMIDALGDTGHSRFLTPDEYQAYQQSLSGQLTGIGVVLGELNGGPAVIRVLPGTPADRAGLKAGDEIVAVDGKSISGLTSDEIVSLIRGPAGESVTLSVLHVGATTPVDVKITREVLNVPLVAWQIVPGTHVADILLTGFDKGATDQVRAAIKAAQAKGATSMILDLRGNPGGYVNEAIGVASIFLSSGNVYLQVDATGHQTAVGVDKNVTHIGLPLVVLIDNNSASASEIVSGAIKDAGRAKLVGVRTFGTGTVLQPFQLSDGSALYLGVSKFLTPSGKQIFQNGITPDEQVALPLGTAPVDPTQLDNMTAAQFQAIKDTQLLAAAKAAGQ